MPIHTPLSGHRLSRRGLFRTAAIGGAALGTALSGPVATAAPALLRSGRPALTHGVQCGDVLPGSGLVWARANQPSRMIVEVAADPSFRQSRRLRGPVLGAGTDFTGRLRVPSAGLGRTVHYRVTAEDAEGRTTSEPVTGSFRTPPGPRDDVRFVWSGDIAGQGWGIDQDRGGMGLFAAMAAIRPDFYLCSGDTVYADGALAPTVPLPDGSTWRNLVTPEKSKVAETLAEYRGQFAYNLLDDHYRAFMAQVAQINQWDDHEVLNNWYPGEVLTDARYTEKRVDVLAARAFQAFHEWVPIDERVAVDGRVYRQIPWGPHVEVFVLDMRTYRDPNSPGTEPFERILGEAQLRWLLDALETSTATWKVIAADMPIGLVVPDGTAIEAVANNRPGVPAGREAEIATVLSAMARAKVRNVVWLTADVHYTAAHHYSPERAAIQDFDPFWEFVSGPAHAGTPAGPNPLDPTFGPRVAFVHAPAVSGGPAGGFQHFGEVSVDGATGVLTLHLRDGGGTSLWSTTLEPQRR